LRIKKVLKFPLENQNKTTFFGPRGPSKKVKQTLILSEKVNILNKNPLFTGIRVRGLGS
jgi:hypothetical protein